MERVIDRAILVVGSVLALSCWSSGVDLCHETFQAQANIRGTELFQEGEKDFVKFWEKCALDLAWFEKWDKALEWNPPYAKWFASGKLNVSYNCLDRHLNQGKGNKTAFIWVNENQEKQIWSYNRLYEEVNKLANVLKNLGVQRGDRVALYMPMVPEAIASMLACTRIGAVHSVIFGGIGAQSVKDRILDAEASVLITADGSYRAGREVPYKKKLDDALDECPSLKNVIVLKHTGDELSLRKGRDHWYHELMEKAEDYCSPEPMGAEDPLFILYTSGTTGKPKGILHTTGGYLVGVHTTFKWVFDIKPDDIYWSTADIGWITGHSFVAYAPLSNGITQVIYEGAFEYPSRDQFAKIIDENKVTIFYTAPTLVRTFMKWGESCLKGSDLSSLRLLGTIGEPINPESWMWFHTFIGHGKCPIVDTWFQTETGALVISPIPGVTPLVPGSVTKALPGFEVDVLDEDGNSSPRGLLAIKKPYPSMMRGVYKNPDRYVSTYWSQWGGKYYFAGDAARRDEQGNLWIGGRCDEVLKVSGHRIGTSELENALIEHPAVSESAVVGVKDDIKGEKIVAFVILKDSYQEKVNIEEALRQTVGNYLGAYARPEKVVIVDKLPKTRSGKILRRILKNLIEGEEMGSVVTLSDPTCLEEIVEKCGTVNRQFYPEQQQKLLNLISPTPAFKPLDWAPISQSAEELSYLLTPILEEHLKMTNYDRLHLVRQFLDFYESKSGKMNSLEVLSLFKPDTSIALTRGSSCYGLIDELYDRLPAELNARRIPAVLGKRFQQKGWAKPSHVALLIKYASDKDEGYVLLDPNFDIEIPIILKSSGEGFVVDMKNKGRWNFRLKGDQIIVNHLNGGEEWNTVYDLKEYLNSSDVAIKPMIAGDRKICLISRNAKGEQQAYFSINLDQKEILWAIGYERQPSISFDDFLNQKNSWSPDFYSKFSFSKEELDTLIVKTIHQAPLLDKLREQYFDLLKKHPRKSEFYFE